MVWRNGLAVLLSLGACAIAMAQPNLAAQQEQARKQQAELRRQIETLQSTIESSTREQEDASQTLRKSEKAISDVDRRLEELKQRQSAVQENMQKIAQQREQQEAERERHQRALADQLSAQYKAGSSPWAALLSGNDPNLISRDLYYLSYVSRQQTEQVLALRRTVERLAALRAQAEKNEQELAALAKQTQEKRAELEREQQTHAKALASVQATLATQQKESGRLQQHDKRLSALVDGLELEIARQAELARKAEEQRRLEAAKRAEQERLQRQAQEREQARLIAQQTQARKAREQELLERARASQAPIPVAPERQSERIVVEPEPSSGGVSVPSRYSPPSRNEQLGQHALRSGTLTAEETNMPAPPQAQPAVRREPEVPEPSARPAKQPPAGGFNGLQRGLLRPTSGAIQGRFGKERPDGGAWRGVVLRAQAGESVKAVSAGRVVFANWLSGFGNILILDHGREFLTVYAYNQSLLKQVGDIVDRGELIARVGSTGGQVEPGLYFEIRHQGKVVNPELWLAR